MAEDTVEQPLQVVKSQSEIPAFNVPDAARALEALQESHTSSREQISHLAVQSSTEQAKKPLTEEAIQQEVGTINAMISGMRDGTISQRIFETYLRGCEARGVPPATIEEALGYQVQRPKMSEQQFRPANSRQDLDEIIKAAQAGTMPAEVFQRYLEGLVVSGMSDKETLLEMLQGMEPTSEQGLQNTDNTNLKTMLENARQSLPKYNGPETITISGIPSHRNPVRAVGENLLSKAPAA